MIKMTDENLSPAGVRGVDRNESAEAGSARKVKCGECGAIWCVGQHPLPCEIEEECKQPFWSEKLEPSDAVWRQISYREFFGDE